MLKSNRFFFSLLAATALASCSSYPYPKYQIDPTPPTEHHYFKDTNITTDIKAAYADDPILNASTIHVTTTGGVVKLTGNVEDPGEIARAAQLAKQTPGVKLVETELKVIPPLR